MHYGIRINAISTCFFTLFYILKVSFVSCVSFLALCENYTGVGEQRCTATGHSSPGRS